MNTYLLTLCLVFVSHHSLIAMRAREEQREELEAFKRSLEKHKSCTPAGEELIERAGAGQLAAVRQLLADNVDVNSFNVHKDHAHQTPLIAAAHEGRLEVVEVLLEHGAAVNFQHSIRWCPPMRHTALTAALIKRQFDVANVLIEHGADVLKPQVASRLPGGTPLMLAAKYDTFPPLGYSPFSRFGQDICNKIIMKMAVADGITQAQQARLVTFLCCLKARGLSNDVIYLFRRPLLGLMKEESSGRACALQEICKIEDWGKKENLLTLYGSVLRIDDLESFKYLEQDPQIRHCWTKGCSFVYSVEEPSRFGQIMEYVLGESTISCPACKQPLIINQPKYPTYSPPPIGCTLQ